MTYEIFKKVGSGSIFESRASELNPQNNYRFKMTATNKDGESPESNVVQWGAERPVSNSVWVWGTTGVHQSLGTLKSDVPAGWWVTETVTPGYDVTLHHYPTNWDGATAPLASFTCPGAFSENVNVTIYPVDLPSSDERGIFIKCKGETAQYPILYWFYYPEGDVNATPQWQDIAIPTTNTEQVKDFIIMEDGVMLTKGDGSWFARVPQNLLPRPSDVAFVNTFETLLGGNKPIPYLQNKYPVTLATEVIVEGEGSAWTNVRHTYLGYDRFDPNGQIVVSEMETGLIENPNLFITDPAEIKGLVSPLYNVYEGPVWGSYANPPGNFTKTYTPPTILQYANFAGTVTGSYVSGVWLASSGLDAFSAVDLPSGTFSSSQNIVSYFFFHSYRSGPFTDQTSEPREILDFFMHTDGTSTGWNVVQSKFWRPEVAWELRDDANGPVHPDTTWGDANYIRWYMFSNGSSTNGAPSCTVQRRYYCDLPHTQTPKASDWILFETRISDRYQEWNQGTQAWDTVTTLDDAGWPVTPTTNAGWPTDQCYGFYQVAEIDEQLQAGDQHPDGYYAPTAYRVWFEPGTYVIRPDNLVDNSNIDIRLMPSAPTYILPPAVSESRLHYMGWESVIRFQITTAGWYVVSLTEPLRAYFDIQPYALEKFIYDVDDDVVAVCTDWSGWFLNSETLMLYGTELPREYATGAIFGMANLCTMNRNADTPTNEDYGDSRLGLTKTGDDWAPTTYNYGNIFPILLNSVLPPNFLGNFSLTNNRGLIIPSAAYEPPVFTVFPQNQTVTLGDPVTFYATAVSFGTANPITYRWVKNWVDVTSGVELQGDTSTYTFTPVEGDDQAEIICFATDFFGQETQSVAGILTVTVATAMLRIVAYEGSPGPYYANIITIPDPQIDLSAQTNSTINGQFGTSVFPSSIFLDTANNTTMIGGSASYGGANLRAIYWIDGARTYLTAGANQAQVDAVFSVGGNGGTKYACGFECSNATPIDWFGDPYMLTVQRIPKVWVNGTPTSLTAGADGIAATISVNGGVVRIGGAVQTSNDVWRAVIWTDGTPSYLTAGASGQDSLSHDRVSQLVVSNGVVYACGWEKGTNVKAMMWVDGVPTTLSTNGSASGIAVNGNDVYVCGSSGGNGVVWKNGVLLYTVTAAAGLNDIVAANNTTYVTSSISTQSFVWDGADPNTPYAVTNGFRWSAPVGMIPIF